MSSTSDELKKIDEERRIQEQVIELKRKEQEEAAKQDEQLVKEARQTIRYIQRHYLTSLDHAIQWFVYMCHEDLLNLIFVVRRSLRWAVLAKLYNLVEWPDGNRRTAMFWEFVKDDLKHESTRIRVLNLIIDFFHLSNHHLTEEKTEKNITIKNSAALGGTTIISSKHHQKQQSGWDAHRLMSLHTAVFKFNESQLYTFGQMNRKHLYPQPIEHVRKQLDKLTGEDGEWWREFVTTLAKPIVDILSQYCNWSFQDQMATHCMRHYTIPLIQKLFEEDPSGRSVFIRCSTAVRVVIPSTGRVNAAYLDKHGKTCLEPFLAKLTVLLLPHLSSSGKNEPEAKKTSFGFGIPFSFVEYIKTLFRRLNR